MQLAEAGVEQNRVASKCGNVVQLSPDSGLAPSLAYSAKTVSIDADLALVIASWPTLPEAARRKIVKAVELGRGKGAS